MAEQVVDIRERIEKMRTQIIEKPNDQDQLDTISSSNDSNVIKKPEKFSESLEQKKKAFEFQKPLEQNKNIKKTDLMSVNEGFQEKELDKNIEEAREYKENKS